MSKPMSRMDRLPDGSYIHVFGFDPTEMTDRKIKCFDCESLHSACRQRMLSMMPSKCFPVDGQACEHLQEGQYPTRLQTNLSYIRSGERKLEDMVLTQLESLLEVCQDEEEASENLINFVSDICHDWVRERTE